MQYQVNRSRGLPTQSALHIRHNLPTIQSKNRREGRDAYEGVLLDIKCIKINLVKRNQKTVDKIEHLFYSLFRTNVPIKGERIYGKE